MNEALILYSCDAWHSHASKVLIAVFSSHDSLCVYLREMQQNGTIDQKAYNELSTLLQTQGLAENYIVETEPLNPKQDPGRFLSEIETLSGTLTQELIAKIKRLLEQSGRTRVNIPEYDGLEEYEGPYIDPIYLYYTNGDGEATEGKLRAVMYDGGLLSVEIGDSDYTHEIREDEYAYLFQSHSWLIAICQALGELLKIDHQTI